MSLKSRVQALERRSGADDGMPRIEIWWEQDAPLGVPPPLPVGTVYQKDAEGNPVRIMTPEEWKAYRASIPDTLVIIHCTYGL